MPSAHRYILHKKIARGGMAEIYLGKQSGSDGFERVCCIKRVLPQFLQDEEFIQMFRDEAHICKRLQHANIVRVESFEEVEGSYAIIMEFVHGVDLRSLLTAIEKRGGMLNIAMAVFIVAEAARGLHYAHTKTDDVSGKRLDIIHRDVSPQNILVSYEGEVKITDFGIADAENKAAETRPGIIKGKYAYMSPEQIKGENLDARTDIFALAVVLWECLAMKRLFQSENEIDTIQNVRDCTINEDLRKINPNVDEMLYNVVMRGLSKDREQRYEDAAAFEKELRKFLSSTYADFTPADLSTFMKALLSTQLQESQDAIKMLLVSRPAEIETQQMGKSIWPEEHTKAKKNAVAPPKDAKKEAAAPPFTPLPRPQQRPQVQHRKSSSSWLILLILLVAGISGRFVWEKYSTGPFKVLLNTTPRAVKISLNQTPLAGGSYVTTPLTLSLSGNAVINIDRQGYKRETLYLNVVEDLSKELVLERIAEMAPVELFLAKNAPKDIWLSIDDGMVSGSLSTSSSLKVQDLVFGTSHQLRVFPEGAANKSNSFLCTFIPRATSWLAPYQIEIRPQEQHCAPVFIAK